MLGPHRVVHPLRVGIGECGVRVEEDDDVAAGSLHPSRHLRGASPLRRDEHEVGSRAMRRGDGRVVAAAVDHHDLAAVGAGAHARARDRASDVALLVQRGDHDGQPHGERPGRPPTMSHPRAAPQPVTANQISECSRRGEGTMTFLEEEATRRGSDARLVASWDTFRLGISRSCPST